MISHACPPWDNPEPDDKLPSIARGFNDFYLFVVRQAKSYILNINDIKMWHGKIFGTAAPLHYYAGNFRGTDERFPCLMRDVHVGGQLGCPFAQVEEEIQKFSLELNDFVVRTDLYMSSSATQSDRVRAAVQLAVFCAGRLIQIHPFINGNGRMARSSSDYFLFRYGFPIPFWPASPRPDPAGGYGPACAACMIGNYSLLYEYLLRVEVDRILEVANARRP